MPYKNREDRLANQQMWYNDVLKLRFYRSMGLEPMDLNDHYSNLRCEHCARVSHRFSAHIFRHYPNCPHLPKVMEILDHPRISWSRRRKVA